MGAVIAIPVITIILISLGYVLWTFYMIVRETVSFAKSPHHGSGETAAHYEPGDHEHVSTKPLKGYGAD